MLKHIKTAAHLRYHPPGVQWEWLPEGSHPHSEVEFWALPSDSTEYIQHKLLVAITPLYRRSYSKLQHCCCANTLKWALFYTTEKWLKHEVFFFVLSCSELFNVYAKPVSV